jgi:NADH-quinone oxidoreductase subunit E
MSDEKKEPEVPEEAEAPEAANEEAAPEEVPVLPPELVEEFEELITHYPDRRSALIPALHRCQEELGGWISPEIMEACAELFELEPVEVFGVASFYPMFNLKPVGAHTICVCHNISCHIRGAEDLIAKAIEVTGAEVGGVSSDGKWTIKRVECQGACTAAPMIDLDGVYHENLTVEELEKILGGVE